MQWRYNTPLERVRTSNTFSNNANYAERTALSIYSVLRACAAMELIIAPRRTSSW
jgi:hypothetical protein